MSQLNLVSLPRPSVLPRFSALAPFSQNRRDIDFRNKVVKKAIHKFCSPDLAQRAIHGFRRSSGSPGDVTTDFMRTNLPPHKVQRDYHYLRALRVTEKLFRPTRRLNPIAFPDLRYYPWTLSSSAEAPYTVEKKYDSLLREKQRDGLISDSRSTFHNLYNEIFEDNRLHVHGIKKGSAQFWNTDGTPKPYWYTTLHARSHLVPNDEPDKLRAVFGLPKLFLQVENMFIWNLQREYLNNTGQFPILWGFETMKGGWRKLFNKFSHKRMYTTLSIDWSGFDRRALHEVIDDVHAIWRSWFDFHQYEPTNFYPDSTANPDEIERLWHWMTDLVKHYPVLTPTGTLYKWTHNGIASGFQQTQLLDSFVNMIMILTCLSAAGVNIESEHFQIMVQGDDSITTFCERFAEQQGPSFLKKLSGLARMYFNAKLSDKKSRLGTSLIGQTVLHYDCHGEGVSIRDPADLLAHLLYPETPQGLAETASAAIGTAQAAMGSSREVYNACHDVWNFITTELGTSARTSAKMERVRLRQGLPPIPKRFPSFDETWNQNFVYATRTEAEKQRLWPTDPTRSGGFSFLMD